MINHETILSTLYIALNPIKEYLEGDGINEIMINPGGDVWIERRGMIEHIGVLLNENQIKFAIYSVAKLTGKAASPGDENALVNAAFEDFRFAGVLHPISPDGSTICIRKHQDKSQRQTFEDMIDCAMITQSQGDFILDMFVKKHQNIIIAGITGSGKTTLLNAIAGKIPNHERVVTIEDTRELHISVANKVSLLSNELNNIHAVDLVKEALRLRPDRILLGETRGSETFDLIRAFNSGHAGISTVHANSAVLALDAIEMLYQMSLPKGAGISSAVVRQYIAKSVNMTIYANRRYIPQPDGTIRAVRKVEEICVIKGLDRDGNYEVEYIK
ncbi:CpaF family protein [Polynucleobacter sp. JS-Safj-400b-B2]|uniref:CpaF family protein n=1 Tax=Polynucleobacter sp. JS-Safj-400b-B2 TaxID=2576921 RepID=UPI001C0AA531|nr:ATPase, T2SS/T4P/T4SS family [Polynucleobacter sp. JS-Safj-400b-B2]MBU3625953.1 CpaF family protein [Polynucleobacter sp. JS-Safj-400b-B2]